MPTAVASRPYIGSDLENKNLIPNALSERWKNSHEIVRAMCSINVGMDDQEAKHVLEKLLPRLAADGFVQEKIQDSIYKDIYGTQIKVYRLLSRE